MPGGLIEDGEPPAETARREPAEETGYGARSLRHLVTYEPAVGSVRNPHHVFVARGVEPTERDEGTRRHRSARRKRATSCTRFSAASV